MSYHYKDSITPIVSYISGQWRIQIGRSTGLPRAKLNLINVPAAHT